MTAIEPGMSLAQSVVPSSGSTAMSTWGPSPVPTFSPMNSIGASSRSPSPMTMRAVDRQPVEFARAWRSTRRLIGGLLVAASAQARRRRRRRAR